MVAELPCEPRAPDLPAAEDVNADRRRRQMPSMQRRSCPPCPRKARRPSNSCPRPLSPSELNVLRAQYDKEGEMGLVKSNQRNDQQLGVRLLSDIFRLSPERRRECLYYLALGNYKLGNYGEARRYNDLLIDKEPANLQASDLRQLIDNKVAKEGLMGVAILSGVGIAAGVIGALIFKNARRR
ncbi:Mitochondria fission 1 protein [Tolypocladium ophioglossoides CBS 100239]|uniref:Mitochondrial fission 1 protein n=1 Tax=Tolypocladium ophioglossoides (strain CBS 100239) TaxID=1163406 RepID=A0A0L0N2Y1_TOLOC|nr:Mitochondria fission 1 protein [Tolypocladium ophioglossoides CBS 100239]